MRDIDIRKALRSDLHKEFGADPNTIIVEELGLCQGDVRIDVAVVNGALHGYEIKSERDTLNRLAAQSSVYNKTLDTVSIIANRVHLGKIQAMIPEWWGIVEASGPEEHVELVQVRAAMRNPDVDRMSLVQLLWRDEAIAVLKEMNLERGVLGKPRKVIWERLANSLSLEDLSRIVRERLKSRPRWRVGSVPARRDARSRASARS